MIPATDIAIVRFSFLDRAKVKAHLKRLTPDDRYLRFCSQASDEFIDSYVDSFNATTGRYYDTGFVAYSSDREILGFAHIAIKVGNSTSRSSAEFGLSVEPAARNQRIGHRLFDRSVELCTALGIEAININCIASNKAMQKIVKLHNIPISTSYGESIGTLQTSGTASLPLMLVSSINDAIGMCTHQYHVSMLHIEQFWDQMGFGRGCHQP